MGGSFAVRNGAGEIGRLEVLFLPDVDYIAGLERELDSTEKAIHRERWMKSKTVPTTASERRISVLLFAVCTKQTPLEMFDMLNASAWVDGPLASMTGCHRSLGSWSLKKQRLKDLHGQDR